MQSITVKNNTHIIREQNDLNRAFNSSYFYFKFKSMFKKNNRVD
jgi:hypothetical protein